jgi:hypothetical protein
MLHKLYYLSETRTSYDSWYIVLVLNSYHKKGLQVIHWIGCTGISLDLQSVTPEDDDSF